MNDKYYMSEALKEANKAFFNDEMPIGAVIVENDTIIARGCNSKDKSFKISDHAEIIAINKAGKRKKNWRLCECTLYVTMEPCVMCASAVVQSRIKRIVIGASNTSNNSFLVKQILRQNKELVICEDVLSTQCKDIIDNFFNNKLRNR